MQEKEDQSFENRTRIQNFAENAINLTSYDSDDNENESVSDNMHIIHLAVINMF